MAWPAKQKPKTELTTVRLEGSRGGMAERSDINNKEKEGGTQHCSRNNFEKSSKIRALLEPEKIRNKKQTIIAKQQKITARTTTTMTFKIVI